MADGNMEEIMTKRLSVYAILFLIAVATASVQAFVPVDHDDK